MSSLLETARRWHDGFVATLSALRSPLLLLVRLYWGWEFMVSGYHKLADVSVAARYFAGLGIPFPAFNAVLSGIVECGGGLLLLVGLASRVAALLLTFNMVVAYLTASRAEALALFTKPGQFVTAPEFLPLLASLLVLAFGPGLVSLDALLGYRKGRRAAAVSGAAAPLAQTEPGPAISRRALAEFTAAAVVGLVAGAQVLRNLTVGHKERTKEGGPQPEGRGGTAAAGKANEAAIRALDEKAPAGIKPSLLLGEPHVCRGLNTCKGKAKDGKNACAGRGACATAERHACTGLNECKGQGGCGQYPGQNTCKGKGSCAVPLKKETWAKARPLFEKLMALKGESVGPAPAKSSEE